MRTRKLLKSRRRPFGFVTLGWLLVTFEPKRGLQTSVMILDSWEKPYYIMIGTILLINKYFKSNKYHLKYKYQTKPNKTLGGRIMIRVLYAPVPCPLARLSIIYYLFFYGDRGVSPGCPLSMAENAYLDEAYLEKQKHAIGDTIFGFNTPGLYEPLADNVIMKNPSPMALFTQIFLIWYSLVTAF